MTSVSIAMASYNGERFIGAQLESLAAQSRLPDELVVSDDGSSDRTVEIIRDFAATAPFPVLIEEHRDRRGYSGNFERAIESTSGDVIFISDQDDIWYPKKIERVLAVMDSTDRAIVTVNDQRIVGSAGESSGQTIFLNSRRAGFGNDELIAGSCTALPRSFLQLLLPFPSGVPYDSWIGAVGDCLGLKRLIYEPLQDFRRHGANTSQPIAISSPHRLGAFSRYGFSDPRARWAQEIEWREILVKRLLDGAGAAISTEEDIARAVALNRGRIQSLQQRSAVLDTPPFRRWPAVFGAWRDGLYRDFAGLQSMLKDLVRP